MDINDLTKNVIQLNTINAKGSSGKKIWFEDLTFGGSRYNRAYPSTYLVDANACRAYDDSGHTDHARFFKTSKTRYNISTPIENGAKYLYVVSGAFYQISGNRYQITYALANVLFGKYTTEYVWVDNGGTVALGANDFAYGIKVIKKLARDENVTNGYHLDLVEMVFDLSYFANLGATYVWFGYPANEIINTKMDAPLAYYIYESTDD